MRGESGHSPGDENQRRIDDCQAYPQTLVKRASTGKGPGLLNSTHPLRKRPRPEAPLECCRLAGVVILTTSKPDANAREPTMHTSVISTREARRLFMAVRSRETLNSTYRFLLSFNYAHFLLTDCDMDFIYLSGKFITCYGRVSGSGSFSLSDRHHFGGFLQGQFGQIRPGMLHVAMGIFERRPDIGVPHHVFQFFQIRAAVR